MTTSETDCGPSDAPAVRRKAAIASPSARAARQPKFSMWKVGGTGFSLAELAAASRLVSGAHAPLAISRRYRVRLLPSHPFDALLGSYGWGTQVNRRRQRWRVSFFVRG